MRLNIHEAKTHLSRYLSRLKMGDVIVLCRRNVPVAEIRAVAPGRGKPRKIGVARGEFTVTPSFFKPLPDELTRGFGGDS